ncbi:MAG: hypothetical protein J6H19_04955 [Bacteroidaceae bacterium]|nr:hypothetical protein [Bacteroidaceae bacterium]
MTAKTSQILSKAHFYALNSLIMCKNPFVSAHILCLLIIGVVKTAFRHFELPLAVACLFAASGTRCAPVSGNFKKSLHFREWGPVSALKSGVSEF